MLSLSIYKAVNSAVFRMKNYFHLQDMATKCITQNNTKFSLSTMILSQNGRDSIKIGDNTMCMGELLTSPVGGKIEIGDWCYVGPNAKIWSFENISIGNRVFISHGVSIFDNNSHSLSSSERHERFVELMTYGRHQAKESIRTCCVRVDDDVWIGFNASILKGVKIGRGAIIGAGAVITHDVPPLSIMVGNPARNVGMSLP